MPNQIPTYTHAQRLPALHTRPWAPPTHKSINGIDLSRHMTWAILPAFPALESLRPHLDPLLAARRPLRSQIGITSSSLPTRRDHLLLELKSASRSILLRSNVPSAPRSLLAPTICDRIFALIRTSDHLYARYAARLSLVNMIVKDTRVCTVEKRSLFAVVSLAQAAAGDAAEDSLVRTLSAGISEAKPAGSASSRCSMKRRWSDSVSLTSR